MPNSVVALRVSETYIYAELQLPLPELQLAVPFDVSSGSALIMKNSREELQAYILNHISLQSPDAENWSVQLEQMNILEADGSPYRELVVALTLTPPAGTDTRNFTLNYDVILHQLVTHSAFIKVDEDWENGINQEHPVEVGIIKVDVRTGRVFPLAVNLNEGSMWKGSVAIFRHGMEHIRLGLDHILFLLTLLLVAPLAIKDNRWTSFQGFKYTLNRFLKISLAFTIGHSITLLIGSLNLLPFSTQSVEVLIAFSILISAVHVIKPIFPNRELGIAAGFGLIHGLAFSLSLSGMQLDWQQKLLSVLSFNLGIETMQLIIMVLFFPLLLFSRSEKGYAPLRIGVSFLTIIVSVSWIIERISGNENAITMYINKVFT